MGFGFNLLFVFLIVPLTALLVIVWLIWRPKFILKMLGMIWGGIFCMVMLAFVIHFFIDKKDVSEADIYGQYIIDRTKFPGRQADWQYTHYSFEITLKKVFLFHTRSSDGRVVHTDSGYVNFLNGYTRPRVIITVNQPRSHIINDTPTLYRAAFSFYYVFHSPKFGNVFFTKGNWKPLDK